MRQNRRRWAFLLALLLTLVASATQRQSAQAQSGTYIRSGLTQILTDGGRVEWSHDGATIFFDRLESDGLWDVWRMSPDGSGQSCLTCAQPALPNKHQGQPTEHPSGRYVVFQAEKASHSFGSGTAISAPGAGVYNDLWALDLQTDTFHQLTDVSSGVPVGGSLHPHFNGDGTRLLWGDLQSGGPEFGNWRIAYADFVETPVPHLENVSYHEPGAQQNWYETHSFVSDSEVIITAAAESGMNDRAMDIYRLTLPAQQLTRLTPTSGINGETAEWDEHAHLSPGADAIAWMSSEGYGVDVSAPILSWLRCEMWLMNPDGSGKERVTFFNAPGHAEYQGGGQVCVGDMSWHPAGTRVALYVQFLDQPQPNRLWIIDFSAQTSVGGDARLPESVAAEDGAGGAWRLTGMLVLAVVAALIAIVWRSSRTAR